MNKGQALAFIVTRLQPEVDPVLSNDTLLELLDLAKTTDADDLAPDDEDWTPTYSTVGCYRAIAEGYSLKHGAAVGRFRFQTDGQTFDRNQTLDHLEHQRRLWARKCGGSTHTPLPC